MSEKKQEKGRREKSPKGPPELGVIGDIEQRLSLSFQAQPLVIPDDGRGPPPGPDLRGQALPSGEAVQLRRSGAAGRPDRREAAGRGGAGHAERPSVLRVPGERRDLRPPEGGGGGGALVQPQLLRVPRKIPGGGRVEGPGGHLQLHHPQPGVHAGLRDHPGRSVRHRGHLRLFRRGLAAGGVQPRSGHPPWSGARATPGTSSPASSTGRSPPSTCSIPSSWTPPSWTGWSWPADGGVEVRILCGGQGGDLGFRHARYLLLPADPEDLRGEDPQAEEGAAAARQADAGGQEVRLPGLHEHRPQRLRPAPGAGDPPGGRTGGEAVPRPVLRRLWTRGPLTIRRIRCPCSRRWRRRTNWRCIWARRTWKNDRGTGLRNLCGPSVSLGEIAFAYPQGGPLVLRRGPLRLGAADRGGGEAVAFGRGSSSPPSPSAGFFPGPIR